MDAFKVKVRDYSKVFDPVGRWKPGKEITFPGKNGESVRLVATKTLFLWENKQKTVMAVLIPSSSEEGPVVDTAEEGIAAVYGLMYMALQDKGRSSVEIAVMGLKALTIMKNMMDRFKKQCRSKKAKENLESKAADWMLALAAGAAGFCNTSDQNGAPEGVTIH